MFFDNRKVKSHNCIYNFIDTERNDGKTWSFKIAGVIRFIKHHKKTVWNRTFVSEKKVTKKNFLTPKIIRKINEELHKGNSKRWNNVKVKLEDFVLDGDYLKYKPYNDWCFNFTATGQQASIKSVDDELCDTIVYDEYAMTPALYSRYRGNLVQDFNDLFTTKKREHIMRVYFLGNKEMLISPFKNYFGIEPLPVDFEGIRHYKEHTILVYQNNTPPEEIAQNDYDKRVATMFKGTAYGQYLYAGAVKGIDTSRIARRPPNASVYCCFDLEKPVTAYFTDGKIYFDNGVDKKRVIVTRKPTNKYKRVFVLTKADISRFLTLKRCFKMNNVYYTSELAFEQGQLILNALNII